MIRAALAGLAVLAAASGCVSLRALEQERVDQGRLRLDGTADPDAPRKTRKIIGIDIELPRSGESNPPEPQAPAPARPEEELSVLPMKGLRSEEAGR